MTRPPQDGSLNSPASRWSQTLDLLFRQPTNHTAIQLVRYTLVGGVAYAVDFGVLVLLTESFGVHYLRSAAIAFLLGLIVNYLLSVAWIFSRHTLHNRGLEFALYAGVGLVGLGLNEIFLWLFTEEVGLDYRLSKVVATGFVYLWNFFARKFLLFR